MRVLFHTPSRRYGIPNLAQSRAVAYMYDEPMNVQAASVSSTALDMPSGSNSARLGNVKYVVRSGRTFRIDCTAFDAQRTRVHGLHNSID